MPPRELLDALRSGGRFLILGHKEPDADCLGSQIAAGELVSVFGGSFLLASPGPFQRPEIMAWREMFETDPGALSQFFDHVLVLDCSTPDRLGNWSQAAEHRSVLVVDHHSTGLPFGSIRYIDGEAPSAALLVYRVFRELKVVPSKSAAEALMLGSCTDTGFFRHLEAGAGETLRMSAEFSDAGVSLKEIHRLITSGKTSPNARLLGRILERHELWHREKVVFTYETEGERKELGADARSSDTLYQLFLGIDSVEVIVILREDEDGATIGGLRSRSEVDCGKLAAEFGGGGHMRAAGFRVERPWQEVRSEMYQRLAVILA